MGGYVLDLQQVTPSVWRAINQVLTTLRVFKELIPRLSINEKRAYELCGPPTAMTELANYLTTSWRIPYRTAHKICGELSLLIVEGKISDDAIRETLRKHGIDIDLMLRDVLSLLEPKSVVNSYATLGSANPNEVSRMNSRMREEIEELRAWLQSRKETLAEVEKTIFENL
jgi:argininosuccinate lyase